MSLGENCLTPNISIGVDVVNGTISMDWTGTCSFLAATKAASLSDTGSGAYAPGASESLGAAVVLVPRCIDIVVLYVLLHSNASQCGYQCAPPSRFQLQLTPLTSPPNTTGKYSNGLASHIDSIWSWAGACALSIYLR